MEYLGNDGVNTLIEYIISKKFQKVAVFTGNKSFEQIEKETQIIEKLKTKLSLVKHVKVTVQNPTSSDISQYVSKVTDNEYECFISIGGGSVIDLTKLVSFFKKQEHKLNDFISGQQELTSCTPIIAIPTTVGTGSEVTTFATFYHEKRKFSLDTEYIKPIAVIVDPAFTKNLPHKVLANTAADALTQAIESFWSVKSNEESRLYAKKAIELIVPIFIETIETRDPDLIHQLAKGAFYAGKAINISRTTACHSLSYPLTSHFGIEHGQAVSISLPEVFDLNSKVSDKNLNDQRGKKFVDQRMQELTRLLGQNNINEAKEFLSNLFKKTGLKSKLSDLGVSRDFLETYLSEGFSKNRMGNNPRSLDQSDVEKLFLNIL